MLQADDKLIPRKSHSTVSIKSFKSVLLTVFIHFLFHMPEGFREDACNDYQHDPQDNIHGVVSQDFCICLKQTQKSYNNNVVIITIFNSERRNTT